MPDGDERQERRAEGAEGQPDDERDREHRAQLDDRQRVLDLLELREAGRAGAR